MEWIKWGEKYEGKRRVSTWGEFIGIDKHGGIRQIKLDNGKFYHHFDLARHYPIEEGVFTHYAFIEPPKQ